MYHNQFENLNSKLLIVQLSNDHTHSRNACVNYRGKSNFSALDDIRVPKELENRVNMTRQTFGNFVS